MENKYLIQMDTRLGWLNRSIIDFNQLSVGTCLLEFELTDNRVAYDLTDKRVMIEVLTPGGATIEEEVTVIDALSGRFDKVLSAGMITEQGIHYLELSIYSDDNTKLLCTGKARYAIGENYGEKNVVQSSQYSTLQQCIMDVKTVEGSIGVSADLAGKAQEDAEKAKLDSSTSATNSIQSSIASQRSAESAHATAGTLDTVVEMAQQSAEASKKSSEASQQSANAAESAKNSALQAVSQANQSVIVVNQSVINVEKAVQDVAQSTVDARNAELSAEASARSAQQAESSANTSKAILEEKIPVVDALKESVNNTVSTANMALSQANSAIQNISNLTTVNQNMIAVAEQNTARANEAITKTTELHNVAQEKLIATTAQAEIATQKATEASDQVDLAKAEVVKATQQVALAQAEVGKATAKATEATTQANRAKTEADRAGAAAVTEVRKHVTINQTEATNFDLSGEDGKIKGINVGGTYYDIEGMTEVAEKSITPQKTTFFVTGKNLFDKDSAKNGYYINQTNGNYYENPAHTASDFINIEPNVEYVFNYVGRYCFYDSDKKFISGAVTTAGKFSTFTTPINAKYFVFSFSINPDSVQLEIGITPTEYEAYYCKIPLSEIEEKEIVFNPEMITHGSITEDKTIFFEMTSNMIDKSQCTCGFVSGYDGKEYEHATYWRTGFIKVEPNTVYSSNALSVHSAMYDVNKKYIGQLMYTGNTFVATDNTEYVRVTISSGEAYLDKAYMCKGDKLLPYEPFGYYLKNNYIKKQIEPPIVNLPNKLYALVGQEFNIYFDNIIEGRDTDYSFDVSCGVGMQIEGCYRVTPETKGEYPITIDIYINNIMIAKATSNIIVSDAGQGSGVTKKVIIIGDSTTNNGICVTKLNQNFETDTMNISTLGTRGTGVNKHEGRSGWTFKQYLDTYEDTGAPGVVNSFYNQTTNTFDFTHYLATSGVEKPDYVFINLGINDTFSFSSDTVLNDNIVTLFERCDFMINSIKTADATIKIGIAITIPPNYSQDAFGKAYKCGQTRDRYKRNNIIWCNELIKKFENREAENLYLIPIHCNIDTKYNFGFEEIKVNARSEITYQSPVANGGVHPVDSGYWQCADSYWYFLKSFEI